jgi:hypothetical protein
MNIHEARGALFKVKLPTFGYTLIAKATGMECVGDLIHESKIYSRLLSLQVAFSHDSAWLALVSGD